jgi:hypothetical protein
MGHKNSGYQMVPLLEWPVFKRSLSSDYNELTGKFGFLNGIWELDIFSSFQVMGYKVAAKIPTRLDCFVWIIFILYLLNGLVDHFKTGSLSRNLMFSNKNCEYSERLQTRQVWFLNV